MLRYDGPDWRDVSLFYRATYRLGRRPLIALVPLFAKGAENMPRSGGVIIAPNHQTYADPVLVAAVMPRPSFFLAKAELFRNRFTNWFFRSNGAVPVFRGAREGNPDAVRFAREKLESGHAVMVYPEATRAGPDALLEFRTGVARLALETGCPILPVGLDLYRFWPHDRTFPRFGRGAWIAVGEPWTPARDLDVVREADPARAATRALAERVGGLVAECRAARARRDRWKP
ncbi:MAG TPA: lysophospholipid acyltransferase family protein [Candidatus Thermoplasmatota archaeon]|nr:lysophospholipid acyltransferase family protein [Candidatus Thermoplasmatota archaeon]